MSYTKKELSKSQIEFTIEVSVEEQRPFLTKAAEQISEDVKVEGFRPGKAPYDMVKARVGEMAIYEHAADNMVGKKLFEVLEKEMSGVEIVGQPQITIEKIVPSNPLVFKAVVTLLPEIKLGDYKKLEVRKPEIKVDEKKLDEVINNFRQMYAKEAAKADGAVKGDKITIDLNLFLDNVPVEQGATPNYSVIIGEQPFIPGFEEQILGMKRGEKKEFTLKFPDDYYAKNLAGKNVEFRIEAKEVYSRELPEINDEFLKQLGRYSSKDEFIAGLRHSLEHEEEERVAQKVEIEMLDKLIAATTFSEIPENLIEAEAHKMVHEMEHNLESQGLKFEDYLTHLKKTEAELEKDFRPEAEKRVKSALIVKEIAKEQKIVISDDEVNKEIEQISEYYPDNKEVMDNIRQPAYKSYLKNILTNRKVIEYLKSVIIE